MAKTYRRLNDDDQALFDEVRAEFYGEYLDGVTVVAMFVADDDPEKKDRPVLQHHGRLAAGVCRIVNLRDRAAGLADAMIVFDSALWDTFLPDRRRALIDHELHHIERVTDADGKTLRYDSIGRPKLAIRPHDWAIGVFDIVAERHGKASIDVAQVHGMMTESGQLYMFEDENVVLSGAAA